MSGEVQVEIAGEGIAVVLTPAVREPRPRGQTVLYHRNGPGRMEIITLADNYSSMTLQLHHEEMGAVLKALLAHWEKTSLDMATEALDPLPKH